MTEIVFAIPIMHGREDLDRQTREEMAGLAGINTRPH